MCMYVWPEVALLSNIIDLSFDTGSVIHLGLAIQYPRLSHRHNNAWSLLKMFICWFVCLALGVEPGPWSFWVNSLPPNSIASLERSFSQKQTNKNTFQTLSNSGADDSDGKVVKKTISTLNPRDR